MMPTKFPHAPLVSSPYSMTLRPIKQVERLKDDLSRSSRTNYAPRLPPSKDIRNIWYAASKAVYARYATALNNTVPITELPESYDLRSLSIVQSQTEHLERLVNDLLDLSQVQWGQFNLHYETFYLADLLTEMFALYRQALNNITFPLISKRRDKGAGRSCPSRSGCWQYPG